MKRHIVGFAVVALLLLPTAILAEIIASSDFADGGDGTLAGDTSGTDGRQTAGSWKIPGLAEPLFRLR